MFQESWLLANQELIIKQLNAQNLNTDSKRFSIKQNVSPDNVFLFETLHITPRAQLFEA